MKLQSRQVPFLVGVAIKTGEPVVDDRGRFNQQSVRCLGPIFRQPTKDQQVNDPQWLLFIWDGNNGKLSYLFNGRVRFSSEQSADFANKDVFPIIMFHKNPKLGLSWY